MKSEKRLENKFMNILREHQSLLYYQYIYIPVVETVLRKMIQEFPKNGSKNDIIKWYKEWLE